VEARIRLFLQVCEAVEFAHRNLIIHGDLKPANILVTADGTVKLLDFGTAKLVRDPEGRVTQFASLTPRYASPEQLRGERVNTLSDVFSLGVILYEC
jgi:serine/threonine protein kinase